MKCKTRTGLSQLTYSYLSTDQKKALRVSSHRLLQSEVSATSLERGKLAGGYVYITILFSYPPISPKTTPKKEDLFLLCLVSPK